MKRLLAAAIAAASFAVTAPAASAVPCVTAPNVVHACYLDFGASGRGAGVIVYPAGTYAFVLAGCYYPYGSPRYYVGVGTAGSGGFHLDAPVGGVRCV